MRSREWRALNRVDWIISPWRNLIYKSSRESTKKSAQRIIVCDSEKEPKTTSNTKKPELEVLDVCANIERGPYVISDGVGDLMVSNPFDWFVMESPRALAQPHRVCFSSIFFHLPVAFFMASAYLNSFCGIVYAKNSPTSGKSKTKKFARICAKTKKVYANANKQIFSGVQWRNRRNRFDRIFSYKDNRHWVPFSMDVTPSGRRREKKMTKLRSISIFLHSHSMTTTEIDAGHKENSEDDVLLKVVCYSNFAVVARFATRVAPCDGLISKSWTGNNRHVMASAHFRYTKKSLIWKTNIQLGSSGAEGNSRANNNRMSYRRASSLIWMWTF